MYTSQEPRHRDRAPGRTLPRRLAYAVRTAAAAIVVLVGCSGDDLGPARSGDVASVALSETAVSVPLGGTAAITARAIDGGGNELAGRRVFWSSKDPNIASVNEAGLVTGVAAGATQVSASVEGRSAIAEVTVVGPAAVASVALVPNAVTLRIGANTALTARTLDDKGVDLGRKVTWSSKNTQIAVVSEAGIVTGVAAGATEIVATSEGRTAIATVSVLTRPVATIQLDPTALQLVTGASARITARAVDDAGGVVNATLQWTSSDASIARVGSDGTVTALKAGVATITASADGKSASAAVLVSAVPVASVAVSPPAATVLLGQTLSLQATPKASDGTALSGRVVAWTTSNPAVITITSSGVVTAVGAGTADAIATVEGVTAKAAITVPPTVATVSVSPASNALVVGGTVTLTATARAADGQVLSRTFTWSSSDPAVASVNGGVVTALKAGSTTITATTDGVTGSANVAVTTTYALRISPSTIAVKNGNDVQLELFVRINGGDEQRIPGNTPGVVWTSSDVSVATVNGTGRVSSKKVGSTTIKATYQGAEASAVVTVTP